MIADAELDRIHAELDALLARQATPRRGDGRRSLPYRSPDGTRECLRRLAGVPGLPSRARALVVAAGRCAGLPAGEGAP